MKKFSPFGVIVWLAWALAACGGQGASATLYIPPTNANQTSFLSLPTQDPAAITPTSDDQDESSQSTPTPPCEPGLVFLEDLTIPDGSVAAPEEQLDKRWQVENSGTCNWDSTYGLQLIAGPDLGAPQEQALFPARSGIEAMIRMLFTAPTEPGTYRSAWQAHDPQGRLFGDPFFIEIVVEAP